MLYGAAPPVADGQLRTVGRAEQDTFPVKISREHRPVQVGGCASGNQLRGILRQARQKILGVGVRQFPCHFPRRLIQVSALQNQPAQWPETVPPRSVADIDRISRERPQGLAGSGERRRHRAKNLATVELINNSEASPDHGVRLRRRKN